MGKETRAIDIVRKSRLNFPRDWHKIMNIMPSLCGVPSRPSFVDNSSTSRRSSLGVLDRSVNTITVVLPAMAPHYHRSVAGNGTAPSTRTDGLKVRLQSKRETTSIVRRVCGTSSDGIHRNGPPDRPPSRPKPMPRDTDV